MSGAVGLTKLLLARHLSVIDKVVLVRSFAKDLGLCFGLSVTRRLLFYAAND